VAGLRNIAIGRVVERIPGLRRIPAVMLLEAAEIVLLARDHITKLEPHERRRVLQLLRKGRLRPSHLSGRERDELAELAAKAEPRQFIGLVAEKLSPVPLPKRLVHGPSRS
jgi:hypothetical protein